MESQSEATASRLDTPLLSAAVVLLTGAMIAFYYFDGRLSLLLRLAILFGGSALGLAAGYRTAAGQVVWAYLTGARVELRKVAWPSRQESVQVTLMIAGVVIIVAGLMWGLDRILLYAVQKLMGGSA